MSADPTTEPHARHAGAERQQGIWPWLVAPLVALALFFILQSFRNRSEPPANAPAATDTNGDTAHEGAH